MSAQEFFNYYLPDKLAAPVEARAFAPSNVALSKYWGKRDKELNLPTNSSLSVSLGDWGTTTSISAASGPNDRVIFDDIELAIDDPAFRRLQVFLDRFRRRQNIPLTIVTKNSVPTSAGLASSASGFAALTLALNASLSLDLPKSTLSMMARFGSGSAARSLWHSFVLWERGSRLDHSDCVAAPLEVDWPDFRVAIVTVDTGPKAASSSLGMLRTAETSPFYEAWTALAETDCQRVHAAVVDHDLVALGKTAEGNALAMHAIMLAARPPLTYIKPATLEVLEKLWRARQDGLRCYATIDAGPNVKLIFAEPETPSVLQLFPEAHVIAPFDTAQFPPAGCF